MAEPIAQKEAQEPLTYEQTVIAAIRAIGSLSIMDKIAVDNKLTEDEVLRSNAMMKAYNEVSKKPTPDVAAMYEKIEQLTAKYEKDPKVIKQSKAEFTKLQTEFSDSNPTDGSIDINEIASKKLETLSQAFPEDMKKANDNVQKQKDYGATLSPTETLGKIADSVAPAITR